MSDPSQAFFANPRRHCKGMNPNVFFDGTPKGIGICQGCPVQKPCLEWALANGERGTWGGVSERGRKRMRKASKPAA